MTGVTGTTSWQTLFLEKGINGPCGGLALSFGAHTFRAGGVQHRNALEPQTKVQISTSYVVFYEPQLSALSNGRN